jgi:hypothetical protein
MSSSSTPKPDGKRRAPRSSHTVHGGTSEANRRAVAVLEVLGGLRTPADAAAALGIAVPRYYQLETRALERMVTALEPRSLGKQPSLEGRVVRLQKELEQARRECGRQQALVRVAQRSLGLKPPSVPNGQTPAKDRRTGLPGTGRRKRKPTVRALKAAAVLRMLPKDPRDENGAGLQQEALKASGREVTLHTGGPENLTGSRSVEEQPA